MTQHRRARAAVLEAPRRLTVRELELPEIADDDALMRVEGCGLCGTDHEQWSGGLPAAMPMIPGHEAVGVIEAIGPIASQRWGVTVGDRVAVEVFQSCRVCEACRDARIRDCVQHGLADPYGQIPLEQAPSLWGGYAEHQYLGPDACLQPVPRDMPIEVAAAFNAVAAGHRWGVSVPGTRPGDRVAVLGPGLRGLSAAAAAKEAGASFVMVTGAGPTDDARLEAASWFGADLTVNVAREDPVAAFAASTGQLADVVIDVTANAPAAFVQALELAANDATIVVAGTRGDVDVPGFRPDTIVTKRLRIQGTVGVTSDDYRASIELLASGRYPFAEIESQRADLAGLETLLAVMAGEGPGPPPLFGLLVL